MYVCMMSRYSSPHTRTHAHTQNTRARGRPLLYLPLLVCILQERKSEYSVDLCVIYPRCLWGWRSILLEPFEGKPSVAPRRAGRLCLVPFPYSFSDHGGISQSRRCTAEPSPAADLDARSIAIVLAPSFLPHHASLPPAIASVHSSRTYTYVDGGNSDGGGLPVREPATEPALDQCRDGGCGELVLHR